MRVSRTRAAPGLKVISAPARSFHLSFSSGKASGVIHCGFPHQAVPSTNVTPQHPLTVVAALPASGDRRGVSVEHFSSELSDGLRGMLCARCHPGALGGRPPWLITDSHACYQLVSTGGNLRRVNRFFTRDGKPSAACQRIPRTV